jgi:3-deoxy-manno-octulosonate cytidylyltransferase (CMP-KDO synthetase)
MSKPKIFGFIPARMASSRFPGKALHPIAGMPMIGHVIKRAQMYSAWSELYLTTCDEEIRDYGESLNIPVIMTSDKHTRALDRIAEAVTICGHKVQHDDIILNVQGDEPMLQPDMIDTTIKPMLDDQKVMGTMLAMPIMNEEQYYDSNALNIIHNLKGDALYTSRSPVPYSKVFSPEIGAKCLYGFFGFRWHYLKMFNELPESPLELAESCDSNRLYDYGYTQRIALYKFVESYSVVDVPEDIAKVEKCLEDDEIYQKYK